jgi:hypothetical protein
VGYNSIFFTGQEDHSTKAAAMKLQMKMPKMISYLGVKMEFSLNMDWDVRSSLSLKDLIGH